MLLGIFSLTSAIPGSILGLMKTWHILAINPGSTSTKIGLYKGDEVIFTRTVDHRADELAAFDSLIDELPMREKAVRSALKEESFSLEKLDALVARGGLLRPIPCGTYRVTGDMADELRAASVKGGHASNLGGLMARTLGESLGIPSYIVDPVIVDEMIEEARISGFPGIGHKSIWHALNQKATARRAAKDMGKPYEDLNLIVAHLGGGISVGAHRKGRTVDVNDGLNGDGPFSPQRTGALPAADVVELCFSGDYSKEELLKIIRGRGGLAAFFGTQDAREVCAMIEKGDVRAERVYRAMAYRIACDIAARAVPLKGRVDAVILTGGLAREKRLVSLIEESVSFLGPVMIYPGEDELAALNQGALRVLRGEEEAADYKQAADRQEELLSFLKV